MNRQDIPREYSFHEDGFTILRNLYHEETLVPLRQEVDAIIRHFESGVADPFEKYYLKHRVDQGVLYDLYQRFPSFQPLASHPVILDVLEEELGPNIFMYENSLVYKPKGKRNGVPFHQDFISRPHEPVKYIVWMALDRITPENGCLRVIPGSHRSGFLKWYRVSHETHHDRIAPGQIETGNAVDVSMNPGDVLIFNMLLVHGSNEAHSDDPRRAYRVSYQGFDRIYTPRGTPLVMRGGTPDRITDIGFESQAVSKGPLRSFINRIGRRLSQL